MWHITFLSIENQYVVNVTKERTFLSMNIGKWMAECYNGKLLLNYFCNLISADLEEEACDGNAALVNLVTGQDYNCSSEACPPNSYCHLQFGKCCKEGRYLISKSHPVCVFVWINWWPVIGRGLSEEATGSGLYIEFPFPWNFIDWGYAHVLIKKKW